MAEQLGTAVLELQVDARAAVQALDNFRGLVEGRLARLGGNLFKDLEKDATEAGQKAGRAIRSAIKSQLETNKLQFSGLQEALDFGPALNGTLKDLREYEKALVALREVTKATAPDFRKLNDVIAATGEAIRNYSASTDQLVDAASRVATREETQRLREQQRAISDAAKQEKEWAGAIREIESAQRSASRATEEANRAYRSQLDLLGGIAKKGARDVGGAIGAVGRGAVGAVKTGVKLGQAGYGIGAELGIFEEPKTGPLKQSIQQVIDRFKFLGEQAKTTRGIILRTLEGVGAGNALIAVTKNVDLLRESLQALSVTAKAANSTTSFVSKFGDYFANSGLGSVGPLKDLFKGLADVEKGGAAIVSFGDQLAQLGVKGGMAGLDAIEGLVKGFTALPPVAQAAALAAPAVFAALSGPLSKKAQEDLTRVRQLLENIGSVSLDVQKGYEDLINGVAKSDFGKLPKLLPPAKDQIGATAEQQTAALRTSKNVEDIINQSRERGVRFLEKQTAEIERQIALGMRQGPSNMLPGYPASPLPRTQYANPIGPELAAQLSVEKSIGDEQERQRKLHRAASEEARRRRLELQATLNVSRADAEQAAAAARKEKERLATARQRRQKDAISSGLIGGAFPLLFGQGLGASIGGGIGGIGGGLLGGGFGFGLSLVGTAIGQQFDTGIKNAQLLGQALDDPIGKFSELGQAGLVSSKGLERQVQALIDTGREAEAAALIQQDLADTYGDLKAAKELANQTDNLNRKWTQFAATLSLQSAGPLAGAVSRGTTGVTSANKFLSGDLIGGVSDIFDSLVNGVFGTNFSSRQKSGASPAATAALQQNNQLLRLQLQQTAAQAQQNQAKQVALQLDESRIREAQALAALAEKERSGPRGQKIRDDARLQRQTIAETARASAISSERELSNARKLFGLSGAKLTLTQEQLKIQEAARIAEQASAARRNYKGSDAQTRKALADAEEASVNRIGTLILNQSKLAKDLFDSATKAVQSITRTLQDGVLQLLNLQGTPGQGLNKFLSGPVAADRIRQANVDLRGQFAQSVSQAASSFRFQGNEAAARDIERFAQRTLAAARPTPSATGFIEANGVRQQVFGGASSTNDLAQNSQAMREFIDAQRTEQRLREDIASSNVELTKAQRDLSTSAAALLSPTSELVGLMPNLTKALDVLSGKDWTVQVNVASDGSSTVQGDAVNSAISP